MYREVRAEIGGDGKEAERGKEMERGKQTRGRERRTQGRKLRKRKEMTG